MQRIAFRFRFLALVAGLGLASLPALAEDVRSPEPPPQSQTGAPAGTPSATEAPPPASQDSGLVLRSSDGTASLRLGFRLFADARADTWVEDQPMRTTFLVRRARIQLDANVSRWFEARLLIDPMDAADAGIKDAWVAVRPVSWLRLQMGKLQVPFGYEWNSTSEKYMDFIERSLLFSALGHRYELGALLNGSLSGERISWSVGFVNDTRTARSDGRDVVGRLSVSPVRGLSLGASGTYGTQTRDERVLTLETGAELVTRPKLEGLRWRVGADATFLVGPYSLKTEYGHLHEERAAPVVSTVRALTGGLFDGSDSGVAPLETDALYVSATWCITGEPKTDKGVVPARPFRPLSADNGPGAWELAARFGVLRIDSRDEWKSGEEVFKSVSAREVTLGVNWYFSSSTRLSLNATRYDIRRLSDSGAYELLARLMLFF